jgi:uncharacterized protein (DUF1778 family)
MKHKSQPRREAILIRVTTEEKALIERAAADAERSISQWARLALLAAVEGAQERKRK